MCVPVLHQPAIGLDEAFEYIQVGFGFVDAAVLLQERLEILLFRSGKHKCLAITLAGVAIRSIKNLTRWFRLSPHQIRIAEIKQHQVAAIAPVLEVDALDQIHGSNLTIKRDNGKTESGIKEGFNPWHDGGIPISLGREIISELTVGDVIGMSLVY